jgi:hypothetical protein
MHPIAVRALQHRQAQATKLSAEDERQVERLRRLSRTSGSSSNDSPLGGPTASPVVPPCVGGGSGRLPPAAARGTDAAATVFHYIPNWLIHENAALVEEAHVLRRQCADLSAAAARERWQQELERAATAVLFDELQRRATLQLSEATQFTNQILQPFTSGVLQRMLLPR